MTKPKLPPKAPIITIQRSEFQRVCHKLNTIGAAAQNALLILEVIDKRAGAEFKQSMRIIRGLPEEGGAHES